MYHQTGTRRETMAKVIERTDKQRFLAWTIVYAEVDEALVKLPGTSQGQKQMEEIIKQRIRYEKLSGRLQHLVTLIKEIKITGENFIIVSDQLFLLNMTYYVLL